ncbi:MAG: phosphatidate cytidylyltransferase [Chloroflexota bacterium]
MTNLSLRLTTAAIGIPALLTINYVGGGLFVAVVAGAAAIGAHELCSIIGRAGYRPLRIAALTGTVVVASLPLFVASASDAWIATLLGILILTSAYFMLPSVYGNSIASWALTLIPPLYIGLCLGHLSLLRSWHQGAWWVAIVLVITWSYDTGAYAAGRLVGRHKFMAHLSPNKTVEGVCGGLAASALGALISVPAVGLAPWQALLLGAAGGVMAQIGDLAESMWKRQAGVKDSGTLVPGHGGLLDRIDSLFLVTMAVFYSAGIFGHAA